MVVTGFFAQCCPMSTVLLLWFWLHDASCPAVMGDMRWPWAVEVVSAGLLFRRPKHRAVSLSSSILIVYSDFITYNQCQCILGVSLCSIEHILNIQWGLLFIITLSLVLIHAWELNCHWESIYSVVSVRTTWIAFIHAYMPSSSMIFAHTLRMSVFTVLLSERNVKVLVVLSWLAGVSFSVP